MIFWFSFSGKSCQYYWGILRGARSNSKRTAKLKNLSGISRKKKTKPYIYQEQMSFLDKINKNDKQEGNLETIYDKENVSESESAATETETEFDHTFDTDTAMDATQMSMNICNREELKKQLFYKSNQLPSIAMSSSVSDIYSESTIQPVRLHYIIAMLLLKL